MSRFWARFSFVLSACVLLAGCYEATPHGSGNGNGSGSGGAKAGTADKIYGVTILDVFRPTQEAMASPACGNVPESLLNIRLGEMNSRISALTTLLDAQSVTLRLISTDLTPADCTNFAPLESRAVTALPDPDLSDSSIKDKPALHVRLVMWFGDSSQTFPSAAVSATDWADMLHLASLGFTRRLSVNHFAFMGANAGYIWKWKQAADPLFTFLATVVADPVPTDQGLATIGTSVNASTATFADWLHQKVTGL